MTPDQPDSYTFLYVHSDIPPGMTINEWRQQRAHDRIAHQTPERDARRRTSRALAVTVALARVTGQARAALALVTARRHPGRQISR